VKVTLELLALFRQMAGAGRLELEVPARAQAAFGAAPCKTLPSGDRPPTVLEALRAAEARLGGRSLLDGEELRRGVLVFLKHGGGATHRVLHPALERIEAGQALVLSTAMGGG
jgi:hypothetical protein